MEDREQREEGIRSMVLRSGFVFALSSLRFAALRELLFSSVERRNQLPASPLEMLT
jgi:hypothetical protein